MNCSRFRFLIQQWFDAPLSAQDERMLTAHIESCDSCARFQHQLDQVVQGTPDVALPDECLPSNLEALAKRIMDQIPQEKPGFFGMFKNLFGGGGGGGKKASAPAKGGKQAAAKGKGQPEKGKAQQSKSGKGKAVPVISEAAESDDSLAGGSQFPHVRRRAEDAAKDAKGGKNKPVQAVQVDEELLATSTRLKNLQQKLQPVDEPQAQSQGMSLGSKFGMNVPMRESGQSEDAPLTLAESIRRKMVEDKAQDQGTSGSHNFGQPADFAQQPSFGQPQGNFGQQFAPPSGFSAEQAASQFAPPAGFGQPGFGQSGGFPPPASGMGQAAPPNQPPSSQQQQPQQQPGQPMVGQWGEPVSAPQPQPQPQSWSADPPRPGVGGDSDWKPAPPTATDWSMGKPQPQPQSGWTGGGNGNWGGEPPTPAPAQPGWSGQQASANQGWGQGQPTGFADQQSQPPQQQMQQPTQPAGNQGWGQPQPSGNRGDQQTNSGGQSWGQAPQQQVQQGAPGNNQQWAQAPAQQPAAGTWGQQQNPGWAEQPAAQAQPAAQQQWGQQQAPAQGSGWGAPAPAAGGQEAWGTAGGAVNAGWNQAQPQAQPQAAGWGQGGGQPAQGQAPPANVNPFLTAAPAPAAPTPPQSDFESWSEEGEQIQTGMWQAFNLDQPEIGTPRGQQQGRPAGGGMGDVSRFDTPIQQRSDEGAALAAAAAGKADPSMFDIPIQERMKMQQQQAAAAAEPAAGEGARWDVPIQQRVAQPEVTPAGVPIAQGAPMSPGAPVAAGGQNKSSIMDRLNKVLGDDLAAMAAANPAGSGWAGAAPAGAPVAPGATAYSAPPAPSAAPVPPLQSAPPAPPQPVAASAAPAANGLFKLDDKAIDKVFKENLGVNDQSQPVGGQPPAPPVAPAPAPTAPQAMMPPVQQAMMPPVPPMNAPAPQPAPAAPPASQPPVPPMGGPRISAVPPRQGAAPEPAAAQSHADSQGLLKHIDDRTMDQIFANNLGVKDASAAGAPQTQQAPQPQMAPPVPPLSARPAAPAMPPQGIPAQAPAPQPGWNQAPAAAPAPQPGWNQAPPAAPAPQPGWNQAPAPQPAAPQPAAPQPAAPTPQPAAPRAGGLLSVDDDAMDRIFSDLGVKEKASGPKINVREAVNQIRNVADVPTPPKVEGIGRLTREEVVSEPTPGKINAIGKFLLDQQDLSKIGQLTEEDLSDTKIRVLTHEASEEINRLLAHIATQPGVVGSVIVGHDGILIASSLPKELDPETIGILSLGIYINTTNSTKKMLHNHLHQLVCRTHVGYLVIADFGGGILITVSNEIQTEKLIPLMRSITQLVAQS
jgi:predicted regulator of Ras-like GTPase activity (Roadblock/LC7/MglB family)